MYHTSNYAASNDVINSYLNSINMNMYNLNNENQVHWDNLIIAQLISEDMVNLYESIIKNK